MTFTLQLPASSVSHYVQQFFDRLIAKNPGENEFHQAVKEVVETLVPCLERHPEFISNLILERLTEPDRIYQFRVSWQDDKGAIQVNKGYRIEFNNAIGPYKGGLRFHPTVNLGILKFLGFEQILKNSLTTVPMGGAKGGSDFDPKGKSDWEVMRFCQAFMKELYKHIGQNIDVPAGDIGVGGREIGYLFGEYKKLTRSWEGVLTGKGLGWGGSLIRPEATGYGATYFAEEMLNARGDSLKGKTCAVSGSGNVAQYTVEKVNQLGGKVITLSDSNGTILDKNGIEGEKWAFLMDLKNNRRGRIQEYADKFKCEYFEGMRPWFAACDVAFPSATQNEVNREDAQMLVDHGCKVVSEGANMPSNPDAVEIFLRSRILYGPGKAANAGGVATSGLEMAQNACFSSWSSQEVDARLHTIMKNIHKTCLDTAKEYGDPGNYVLGANIGGFLKVAQAMLDQGLV
ncbi:MAG: NADP-specific glutamate dehydrogenase [Holophaga sp.]|nr:NADP-specific glutamate dehydrogenase [Holophaga sp.]